MGLYGVFVLMNSFLPPSLVEVIVVTAYQFVIFFLRNLEGPARRQHELIFMQ